MRGALCALALLLCATTAQAHTPEEYRVLAELICAKETRGHPDPDHAVGRHGELGRCQIKPATALMLGVTFDRLVNTEVSVQTAVAVLRWCSALGWHGARRGAHCYNAGPAAAEGTAYTYAKIIATHYAQAIALVRWHKAHIRLAER